MRVFAIKDDLNPNIPVLAYLLYYEKDKLFYIELEEGADSWQLPMILSSFAERGEKTINSYWSKTWVSQRIVPQDRQNLGQILRENSLKQYDEFELLMASSGRCAQDSFFVEEIGSNGLPENFAKRYKYKVEDVIPLERGNVLLFFRDGSVKKCDLNLLQSNSKGIKSILENKKKFNEVSVQTGGYGICWGENIAVSDESLYHKGQNIPLTLKDFRNYISYRVVNTAEAAEILECSRQNIEDLVRRGKLNPVKTVAKNRLFLKSDVQQRKW